jgi:hypothetical protein
VTQPKGSHLLYCGDEFIEVRRLGEKGIGAQIVSLLNIGPIKGGRNHDDGQAFPFRALADPGEHIKPIQLGHL